MPFQKGNQLAKNSHTGRFVKEKYLKKWEEVFDDDPIKHLKKLAEENYSEFLRLGIAAMPKDTNLNAKHEYSLQPDQLQSCVDFVIDFVANKQSKDSK